MTSRKEQSRRSNVVHGWAFRGHTKDEKGAIRHYLATGEVTENLPDQYVHLNERLSNDNSSRTPGTADQSAGSPGPSGPDSSPGSADSVTNELPPQGPQFIKEK